MRRNKANNKEINNQRIIGGKRMLISFGISCAAVLVMLCIGLFLLIRDETAHITQINEQKIKNINDVLIDSIKSRRIVLDSAVWQCGSIENMSEDYDGVKSLFDTLQKYYSKDESFLNVYCCGSDWYYIPNKVLEKDFVIQNREWYIGAKTSPSGNYVSVPYADHVTGKMCITLSQLLDDGDTVVAMDFDLNDIDGAFSTVREDDDSMALLVSDAGTIIAYSEEALPGASIFETLPQFSAAFSTVAKKTTGVSDGNVYISNKKYTYNSRKTIDNWLLIVMHDKNSQYHNLFFEVFFLIFICIACVLNFCIFFYIGQKNRRLGEAALARREAFIRDVTGDLRDPLATVLKYSDSNMIYNSEDTKKVMGEIRNAGLKLQTAFDNMFNFNDYATYTRVHNDSFNELEKTRRKVMRCIVAILVVTMFAAIGMSSVINYRSTISKIQGKANSDNGMVQDWYVKQSTTLTSLAHFFGNDPKVIENYDQAIILINGVTGHNDDVSAAYITSPYTDANLISNNGYIPDIEVTKREWYIGAINLGDEIYVSNPYFDAQTSEYCITMSKCAYDKNGDFVGVCAVDYYVDKLCDILDHSYTPDSYAFLVASDGTILNHPNELYELEGNARYNVEDIECGAVMNSNTMVHFTDYDDKYKVAYAVNSDIADYKVISVTTESSAFSTIGIFAAVFISIFILSLLSVIILMNKLAIWQNQITDKLQESINKANKSDSAKSQFLAQMSHEIRTPINAVLGMNEMILREEKNPELREYSEHIENAGRTLLNLINSILDFSKIESGKMKIIPDKYYSYQMFEELSIMLKETATVKNLKFEVEIDDNLPVQLFGDEFRIRQIVTNLLSNAVKYTEKGSVKLAVGIEQDTDDENRILLCVAVTDTGIGIKPEDVGRLFDSFERVDELRNRNIEGTGLGITIVDKLLRMMNSHLQIESEYGVGSTFSFKLSQIVIDSTPISESRRTVTYIDKRINDTFIYSPDAEILVVDDNITNIKVVEGLLKRNCVKVDTANCGEEAIEKVRNKKYDIILLDHMMPGMDGVETFHTLKNENLINAGTRVIALTANAIAGSREYYIGLGFNDYLSKPVETVQLERVLSMHLPFDKISYKTGRNMEDNAEESTNISGDSVEFGDYMDNSGMSASQSDSHNSGNDEDFIKMMEETFPGIDMKLGIRYCGGSVAFYKDVAGVYAKDILEDKLTSHYDAENWDDYRVVIHAIKSTSKTVGNTELFEMAKAQEDACKNGDVDYIKSHHTAVHDKYHAFREKMAEIIGTV